MKKYFSIWSKKKTILHNQEKDRPYFHEREIWWCSLGANVGYKQDGKGDHFARPVVIVKKFNKEVFWALPLTTKPKEGRYYFPIDLGDKMERKAVLSQIRLIDAKRLRDKFAVVPQDQFELLKSAITALLQ